MHMGKKAGHFETAILVILVLIVLFVTAFFTESKSISGAVTYGKGPASANVKVIKMSNLPELSEGNYYIDRQGVIFWIDDSSKPIVAQVSPIKEVYADRYFYVSGDGTVLYNG